MNGRSAGPPAPGDQSALSLLVNAADSRDSQGGRRDGSGGLGGGGGGGGSLADTLRLRGFGGGDHGPSFEEQLMLQQQAQSLLGGGGGASSMLLSQLRDQGLLSQLGGSLGNQNHQQLAALLGLGGGGGPNTNNDVRTALAAQLRQQQQQQQQQQHQQQHQLSHADILALSRSGALSSSGLAGLMSRMGGGGGGMQFGGAGLASELDNLQRLEELERRQRLMSAAVNGNSLAQQAASAQQQNAMDASGGIRGSALRDERGGGQMSRPSAQDIAAAKPKPPAPNHEHQMHMTAVAPAEASKEDIEKTPGSVIVPCRARGMPMDHNFKTAYFVIPENVKHGEELICSYFACRNAGIKFRYCSHCKVPVAKRNFRKRHKHGGEDIPRGAGDDSGGEEEPSVKKGIPAHIMADQNHDGMEADALSSQSADSNPQEKSDLGVRQGLVQSSMRSFEKKKKPVVVEAPKESTPGNKISTDRKDRWAALLSKRPATKDGDSMSAWLMEVLAVSDLDTPLKSEDGVKALPGKEAVAPSAAQPVVAKEEDDKKEPATADSSPPADNKKVSSPFKGGIVKKKRPVAEIIHKETKASGSEPVTGSFAEWKERKKAKKQAKMNPSEEAEV